MNNTNLIGNLGSAPTLRSTTSGTSVCNFNLAVDRVYYKNTDQGRERQKATDWIPVVVWGAQAENCEKYLQTGSKVGINGRISTRNYQDTDGRQRYVMEVVAEEVQFLGKIKSPADVVTDPAAEAGV